MKKVTLLTVMLCFTLATSLYAKQPEQKNTTQVEKAALKDKEENFFANSDKEPTANDSIRIADYKQFIPASELYAAWNSSVWSNTISHPYVIPTDSIIKQGDTITVAIGNFTYPLLTHYRVNSEFGKRRRRFHHGIDLKLNTGDTVVSTMAGMVRIAKKTGAYGNLVVVRHDNGLETFYGHLSEVLVKDNQLVESGEVVGLGGSTGRSSGPHLHYEVRYLGKSINPRELIDFDRTLDIKSDTLQLTAACFKHLASQTASSTSKVASGQAAGKNRVWTVKKGDTLSHIARSTGISVNQLCKLNGISRNGTLQLKQKIKY